jgi:hypothetical protein
LKKAHEYREHAEECRRLAKTASGEHKAHLENMAETWDNLAKDREERIARAKRISELEKATADSD